MYRFLSWGCGVQSTALGEMSARGELEPLDAIITADTGWERQATYDVRSFYMKRWQGLGMKVEVVSAGNVREIAAWEHEHLPFYTDTGAPIRRKCTRFLKATVLKKRQRELMGFHPTLPPHPKPGSMELWFGISLDEWTRANPSEVKFIVNRWPLLEKRMSREDCETWFVEHHLPVPPKSACVCCPHRSASLWLKMKDEAPDEFQAAVEFDEQHRETAIPGLDARQLFVYKHAEPLREADLVADAARERQRFGIQIPMFICESGLCWV